MKNNLMLFVCILFISNSYSQNDSITYQEQNEYFRRDVVKYDSLKGRHFKEFVRPVKDRPIENSSFVDGVDLAPTFKRKCGKFSLNSERQSCFKNEFYEILRKKFRPPYAHYKRGSSIFLLIQFTINEKGIIENIKFHKTNDKKGKVEKEIKRVLIKFPEIVPAIREGENVSITYHFPFRVKIW